MDGPRGPRIGPRVTGREWRWRLGVGFLAWLSGLTVGLAAPGDLDPTFGRGGLAISFGPHDEVTAMVQLPDGKLVVAGRSTSVTGNSKTCSSTTYLLLVRYLPDGRGDPSFGAGGKLTLAVGSQSGAAALALQPDGKLVVAATGTDLLLLRVLPDGQLDALFGTGGLVTTDFGASEGAVALVLPPDGTIVVLGQSSAGPFLARYQADGRLDGTFGRDGRVTDIFPSPTLGVGMVRQPDGALAVTALSSAPSPGVHVARLLPHGELDATFGVGGQVRIGDPFLFIYSGASLVGQPDGKLVVAWADAVPTGLQGVLTRLLPDGRLDPDVRDRGHGHDQRPRER